MPFSTMSASSSAFVPCGPTPVSVPIAIGTPISTAMRNAFVWSSMTSLAFRTAYGGIDEGSFSARRSTHCGAIKVATRNVPRFFISAQISSVR